MHHEMRKPGFWLLSLEIRISGVCVPKCFSKSIVKKESKTCQKKLKIVLADTCAGNGGSAGLPRLLRYNGVKRLPLRGLESLVRQAFGAGC